MRQSGSSSPPALHGLRSRFTSDLRQGAFPDAGAGEREYARQVGDAVQLPWGLPIMQAPIGPATTPELVASVSAVGALGTVAASGTKPAKLRDQIRAIRSATSNPFCVNLVLAFDQREASN